VGIFFTFALEIRHVQTSQPKCRQCPEEAKTAAVQATSINLGLGAEGCNRWFFLRRAARSQLEAGMSLWASSSTNYLRFRGIGMFFVIVGGSRSTTKTKAFGGYNMYM